MKKSTKSTKKKIFRITQRQRDFLEIFEKQACLVTNSCRKANIHRTTFYLWLENPKFTDMVEELQEDLKDKAEGVIYHHLQKKDKQMAMYYAERKLKDRGYIKREEVEQIGEVSARKLEVTIIDAKQDKDEDGPSDESPDKK